MNIYDYNQSVRHQSIYLESNKRMLGLPTNKEDNHGSQPKTNIYDYQQSVRHQSTSSQSKINNMQGTIPSNGEGIQIGQFAELHRNFTQNDVNTFGALSGDFNPVHFPMDTNDVEKHNQQEKPSAASTITYATPIVHGILLSSIFSTIFGTLIPGSIYRSQSLKFHHPVHVNESVSGRVTVKKLKQINRSGNNGVLCTCDTVITKAATTLPEKDLNYARKGDDEVILCISGEAQVWLPGSVVEENAT
eukprot:CAMPEP_0183736666 /NCGR_PEP_ID=MMETSP0737-20130205/49911_1 /TAXON_ID=385413 /ORGANISM="Thalassiosira miniscula, Strain CCMP1093" /LENGTH=246 /DNA_ID=CAMNT_0025970727 /DNA_START=360 /DNA_END=1100 /DNA_ORIENTATION=+